MEAAGLL